MSQQTPSAEIRNPGPFKVSGSLQKKFMAFAVIGGIAFIAGLYISPTRAWSSFLQNHFYFLSLSLGGLFFAAIQFLTSSMWSAPIRRVFESFTAYLPVALVMFILFYFGLHHTYIWTHADHVKGDIVLEGKAGYLNVSFFMIRNLIALGIWMFFAKKMVGHSIAQDSDGLVSHTKSNQSWSPIFLIVFAITFTMAAFDQFMSLDPHWFSTMFGVYCFSGLFYSVLALIAVVTVYLKRQGALEGIVNENHLHDLGKFMFAFTVFWAYIGFSQFMLIWYANLPEETDYMMHRLHGGWFYVSIFLLVGKFMVPFFALIRRDNKRNENRLFIVGIFMLVAQWIDTMWLVGPEFSKNGPQIGWIEIGTALGFLGIFGLTVCRFLGKHNIVAIRDPKLAESVHHHHQ